MSEGNSSQLSDSLEIDGKMDSEDQFCLQWNDHKSTLVTVFESLLESGTLVDCSLAAEGQFLKAHKVVLSACSPYFELLFSEHRERHPILILKDVKFQELKALMDYMYRGEVNIPQDRLQALLETAESLQIKGLGGCKTNNNSPQSRSNSNGPEVQIDSSSKTSRSQPTHKGNGSRGSSPSLVKTRKRSVSPTAPKRSRHHLSEEEPSRRTPTSEVLEKRSELSIRPCPLPPIPSRIEITPVPSTTSTVSSSLNAGVSTTVASTRREWEVREVEGSSSPVQGNVSRRSVLTSSSKADSKVEPSVEILLTPKTEFMEDERNDNENSIMLDDTDYMDPRSGPSHLEEGSSSQGPGFAPWLSVSEWAAEDVPPHAMGAFRDQPGRFTSRRRKSWTWHYFSTKAERGVQCRICGSVLKYDNTFGAGNMIRHLRIHNITNYDRNNVLWIYSSTNSKDT